MNEEAVSLVQLCNDMQFNRDNVRNAIVAEWSEEDALDVLDTLDTLHRLGVLNSDVANALGENSHVIQGALSVPLHRMNITYNGTAIDEITAQRIAEFGPSFRFFLISVEGPEEVHDSICGEGSFERAVEGLKALRNAGVNSGFTVTLNALNIKHIKDLFPLALQLGLDSFSVSIIKLAGRVMQNLDLCDFSPLELEKAVEEIKVLQEKTGINIYMKELDTVSDEVELLKIIGATKCAAGVFTASVMSAGRVVACPYLADIREESGFRPMNIRDSSFLDIWRVNPEFTHIRTSRIDDRCVQCERYKTNCFAGCPGTTYHISEDPFAPSPFCKKWGLGQITLADRLRANLH